MATYDGLFDTLGLRDWCNQGVETSGDKPMSMAELMARANASQTERPWWDIPFPSLDNLNKSCDAIPRTLTMTIHGDLDVSVLDEMPPGRQPIQTKRYYESQRDKAYTFLKKEVKKGQNC